MKSNKDFVDALRKTYDACLEIVDKKNHDYATTQDPFKNFRFAELVGMEVEDAILVRISDKLARVSNLIRNKKKAEVVEEAIEDTLMDMCNYAAILKVYLEWNKQAGVDSNEKNMI